MLIELGICTACLLVGDWLTRKASSLRLSEAQELLASSARERQRRAAEAAEVESVAKAEAELATYLQKTELRFRLMPEPARLTADSFIHSLAPNVQTAVQEEVEAGTANMIETRAYLALAHHRKGGRHDA